MLEFTIKEASAISGVPQSTLRRWAARGLIPARKSGRDWLVVPPDRDAGISQAVPQAVGVTQGISKTSRPVSPPLPLRWMPVWNLIVNWKGLKTDNSISVHPADAADRVGTILSNLTRQYPNSILKIDISVRVPQGDG